MAWNTTRDIIRDIETVASGVLKGNVEPKAAQAFARTTERAVGLIALEMEHAKLTGRLKGNDSALPTITLGA